MSGLSLRGITKEYEGKPLLRGITLDVPPGEIACLLGPSGSGKSTLLRIIAGLEKPDAGQVLWDEQDLSGTPVHRRQFGFVFQDYALFPHLNVGRNVAFGLHASGLSADEIHARVSDSLKAVNLPGYENRAVQELSGGEQQRVALARTLVTHPRLLLLDEPLAALDRDLRSQLQEELRAMLHAAEAPALYVTHDQEEAFYLADRLYLLDQGAIQQGGEPGQLYLHPVDGKTAGFFGIKNQLTGVLSNGVVNTSLGCFSGLDYSHLTPNQRTNGSKVILLLRCAVNSAATRKADPGGIVRGIVADCRFFPAGFQVIVNCSGEVFTFFLPDPVAIGSEACLLVQPADITVITAEG